MQLLSFPFLLSHCIYLGVTFQFHSKKIHEKITTDILYMQYSAQSFYFLSVEMACRGERVRDHYQTQQGYAACQSTEKVSRLECRGSCGDGTSCCAPLRSKRRKYTFQCTDGSSFVQEVEKVVKCGCTKCPS